MPQASLASGACTTHRIDRHAVSGEYRINEPSAFTQRPPSPGGLELGRTEGSDVLADDDPQRPIPINSHKLHDVHVEQRVLHHYVIVRADILPGLRAAQIIHAAGESALLTKTLPAGTHAVALTADSEAALAEVGRALESAQIPHTRIIENDPPFSDQLMAIGIAPMARSSQLKRLLGRLPTLK